jgi:hypothetical protein
MMTFLLDRSNTNSTILFHAAVLSPCLVIHIRELIVA